ncbi:MAG: caspase family protein [Prosthecobacter sp.]
MEDHLPQDTVCPVVALVIGVRAYDKLVDLSNPNNDADLISNALKSQSYDVILVQDPDFEQIALAVNVFREKLRKTARALGLVYFAGHGFTHAGQTWLAAKNCDAEGAVLRSAGRGARNGQIEHIAASPGTSAHPPAQAHLTPSTASPAGSYPLNAVLDCKRDAEGGLLVFLDCCRTTRSGLPDIATGSLLPHGRTQIVYSASPGQPASDGPPGGNSPFAAQLAGLLKSRDGLTFAQLTEQLCKNVFAATLGEQDPYLEGRSLYGKLGVASTMDVSEPFPLSSSRSVRSMPSPTWAPSAFLLPDSIVAGTQHAASPRYIKSMICGLVQHALKIPIGEHSAAETREKIMALQQSFGQSPDGVLTDEQLFKLGVPATSEQIIGAALKIGGENW